MKIIYILFPITFFGVMECYNGPKINRVLQKKHLLCDFIEHEGIDGDRGATSLIEWLDDQESMTRSGNMTLLTKQNNVVVMKSIFARSHKNEVSIGLSFGVFRSLLIEIERFYVSCASEVVLMWQNNSSVCLDWLPTYRDVKQCWLHSNRYVLPIDCCDDSSIIAVGLLNSVIALIKDENTEILSALDTLAEDVLNFDRIWIRRQGNDSVCVAYNDNILIMPQRFFRLMISHIRRIYKEKPRQVFIKFYAQWCAFEW